MSKAKSKLPDIAIVACHFNPCGYEKPRENLAAVIDHLTGLGVELHLESCRFDDPVDVPEAEPGAHYSHSILWQKEALLNAAVSRLPAHITKVVILDADVLIPDAEWLGKVSAALDTCQIIQPWGRVAFLDKDGIEQSCMASCGKGFARKDQRCGNFQVYHPGFAWAAQRSLWTDGPGLYERCPVGCGDELLATAATGAEWTNKGESEADHASKQEWIKTFRTWNKSGDFGFLKCDIKTLWHGEYKNRSYKSRHALLADFDPTTDLEPKTQPGPVEWSEHALREKGPMIRAVADYFGMRLEDGPLVASSPVEIQPEPIALCPSCSLPRVDCSCVVAGACPVCKGVYSECSCMPKIDTAPKP